MTLESLSLAQRETRIYRLTFIRPDGATDPGDWRTWSDAERKRVSTLLDFLALEGIRVTRPSPTGVVRVRLPEGEQGDIYITDVFYRDQKGTLREPPVAEIVTALVDAFGVKRGRERRAGEERERRRRLAEAERITIRKDCEGDECTFHVTHRPPCPKARTDVLEAPALCPALEEFIKSVAVSQAKNGSEGGIVNWSKARDWEVLEGAKRGWPQEAIEEAKRRGLKIPPRRGLEIPQIPPKKQRRTKDGSEGEEVASACGAFWWAQLHSWASNLRDHGCQGCGEFAIGMTQAMHDLVNVKLAHEGRPKTVQHPDDLRQFAFYFHEAVHAADLECPICLAQDQTELASAPKWLTYVGWAALPLPLAQDSGHLSPEARSLDIAGGGEFVRERVADPAEFDPDSLRTVPQDDHRIITGCPKGSYRKGRCQVGTRAQSILHPRSEQESLVGEALSRGLIVIEDLSQEAHRGK